MEPRSVPALSNGAARDRYGLEHNPNILVPWQTYFPEGQAAARNVVIRSPRRRDPDCASQQIRIADVRFSKADILERLNDVRFTPKSGHRLSAPECPLMHRKRRDPHAG